MFGTLLVKGDKTDSRGMRGTALLAALLLPLLLLVAVSAGSIVRGAEAQRLVLAETYRQRAELAANDLSHRLVAGEEYLVRELIAGNPGIEELAQRLADWEQRQPGLQPMALIGSRDELLRPMSVNNSELEAIILQLPTAPTETPRIAPVVLSRQPEPRRTAATSAAARSSEERRWVYDDRLDTVACQLESKEYRLAASGALSVLRYLVDNRFHLGEEGFDAGFARAEELLDVIPLDAAGRAELNALREEISRMDDVERALRSLMDSLQQVPALGEMTFDPPRIEFQASAASSAEAFAVAEIPGTDMRLVHRLDFSNVDAIISAALESGPLADAAIAVVDDQGRPVAGDVDTVPSDAALVALAAVPGFRVAAFPRSGSLAEMARRDLMRNSAWLLGAVVALAIGGTLGVRGLRRDLAVSRMRADFVSSVSHELKTPLALLSASAENLRAGWVPDERRGEYYDTMISEAQRLSHLVDNVLDFRRMEAGARSFDLRAADLRDLVDDTLALYQMPATSAGIELTVDYPDAPVTVELDGDAIHQVIANLVSNAVKYAADGDGRVAVEVRAEADAVAIAVSDNGPGMTQQDIERAFEPFYRGSAAPRAAGSGIGLSIVRHVVNAHRGEVTIDSAPGAGTTVIVRLPRRQDGPAGGA